MAFEVVDIGNTADPRVKLAAEAADAMDKLRVAGIPVGPDVMLAYANVLVSAQDAFPRAVENQV
jgi:hypothetical protein